MARIMKAAVVAASLFVIAPANAGMTDSASPNDTARVLAGLRPSAGSPLVSLTQDGSWQQHASRFDSIFRKRGPPSAGQDPGVVEHQAYVAE
jgi:hypothetical protein